ncbi:MAG: nucleotidyltransferase [Bacteroidia bacterium]|nr:nucleotidyltransferase [Bacteroidia bacterium]
MKIIVPMAGIGKRMRPHTLTIPKPLLPVAGKPIVQLLLEEIYNIIYEKITEIIFVIGDFGVDIETHLYHIAHNLNAGCKIYYQKEPLGTAHAVLCAEESLNGRVVIAFSDTLFQYDSKLNLTTDASILVQKVTNPSSFGVVKIGRNKLITSFIEKPQKFVSDLAIIGIYFFKDGNILKKELQRLIYNDIKVNGEYQLTDALENMVRKKMKFSPVIITEWLDCGNKNSTIYANQRLLEYQKNAQLISKHATIINSVIIEPCFIGDNTIIENSIIGPYVSIGNDTRIKFSLLKNSIIQSNSILEYLNIHNSILGNFVELKGEANEMSIGDYTSILK